MAERPTLLTRNTSAAPTVQPSQTGAPSGAFGDSRGVVALGQGLSDVGQAGMSYATKMKQELETRTANVYRMQADNAARTALLGVKTEYAAKKENGEFLDGSDHKWMAERLQKARTDVATELRGISSDPIFKKHVPEEAMKGDWDRMTESMLVSTKGEEAAAGYRTRIEAATTSVDLAFTTSLRGDHAMVQEEFSRTSSMIESLTIDPKIKRDLKFKLADKAFNQLVSGVISPRDGGPGIVVPESAINNPLFSAQQKDMLHKLNAQLGAKPEINQSDANKVLSDVVDNAINTGVFTPEALQTAHMMADAAAQYETTPETKRALYAKIELAQSLVSMTSNNFAGLTNGSPAYAKILETQTMFGSDKTRNDLFDSINVKGAHTADRSRYMTEFKARVDRWVEDVQTGRANRIVDASNDVYPLAGAAANEFIKGDGSRRDAAKAYTVAAREKYKQLGIPEHLQVYVPDEAVQYLTGRIWAGDTANGSILMTRMGESFGSQGLGSVANFLLAPGNQPADTSGMKQTAPKNGALAAFFKIASADHARVELGARGLELQPHLKGLLDELVNYEKNSAQFGRGDELVARNAFSLSSFKDPVNEKELLTGEQITAVMSNTQSLPGIAKGMYWQSGQNNDLAQGFQEFATRFIRAKAYSAGVSSGEDKVSREKLAANATNDLNNMLARVFTVVAAGGVENPRAVYDLIPTRMVSEGTFDLPVMYGAQDAADLGIQTKNVLDYIGHHDPKRDWDRGGFSNAITNITQFPRWMPLAGAMYSGGAEGVKPLTAHLALDFTKFHGITRDQYDSGGDKVFNDYITNPKTRFTANSVAFTQNGGWRYNWKTDQFEAMIFPARSSSAASATIQNPGAAQPLMYNYGDGQKPILKPVTVKAQDVRVFDQAYRRARVDLPVQTPNTRTIPLGF